MKIQPPATMRSTYHGSAVREETPSMNMDDKFWDKVADKYAASPIKDMHAYEQTMELTRRYLSKEDRVLEVGCGTGSTALLLAPSVQEITATDTSERMIAIGEEKAAKEGAGSIKFSQVSLPDDWLMQNQFDVVLCFNTLHLMTDLPSVLDNLYAATKPGGYFISKTVCLAEQSRLWSIPIFLLRLIGKAPYVNMLTFRDIENEVAAHGFEIVETGTYPAPHSRFIAAKKV